MSEPIPYSLSEHKVYITNHLDSIFDATEGCDDTGFTITFDNDAITFQESPRGETQYHIRVNKKATMTISQQWGSISNKYLTQAFADQRKGNRLKAVQVKRVSDVENTLLYESVGGVYIRKQADNGFGLEGAPRLWTIDIGGFTAVEAEQIPA
jgi:hypothetical protein